MFRRFTIKVFQAQAISQHSLRCLRIQRRWHSDLLLNYTPNSLSASLFEVLSIASPSFRLSFITSFPQGPLLLRHGPASSYKIARRGHRAVADPRKFREGIEGISIEGERRDVEQVGTRASLDIDSIRNPPSSRCSIFERVSTHSLTRLRLDPSFDMAFERSHGSLLPGMVVESVHSKEFVCETGSTPATYCYVYPNDAILSL